MVDRNREAWLTALAAEVRPLFRGMSLGKLRVTCGWPSRNALGARRRVVGQCFGPESSRDGHAEIFISPLLDQPLEVAGTLTHELAHAVAGIAANHGREFVRVARHVGLTKGKPQQVMPGPHLDEVLAKMVDGLGAYPHSALAPKSVEKPKKASSTVGLACGGEGCECKVSMSRKLLEKCGPPTCACGTVFAEVEK